MRTLLNYLNIRMNLHELLKQCQETALMHILSGNFYVEETNTHTIVIRIEELPFDIWIANGISEVAPYHEFRIQPFDLGDFDVIIKRILWDAFKEFKE